MPQKIECSYSDRGAEIIVTAVSESGERAVLFRFSPAQPGMREVSFERFEELFSYGKPPRAGHAPGLKDQLKKAADESEDVAATDEEDA